MVCAAAGRGTRVICSARRRPCNCSRPSHQGRPSRHSAQGEPISGQGKAGDWRTQSRGRRSGALHSGRASRPSAPSAASAAGRALAPAASSWPRRSHTAVAAPAALSQWAPRPWRVTGTSSSHTQSPSASCAHSSASRRTRPSCRRPSTPSIPSGSGAAAPVSASARRCQARASSPPAASGRRSVPMLWPAAPGAPSRKARPGGIG